METTQERKTMEAKPMHTPGMKVVDMLWPADQWPESRLFSTAWGRKTRTGIAAAIDEITKAPALAEALKELVAWMDKSGLSHTKSVGAGAFKTEPVEFSVVSDARAALKEAGL